MTLDQAKSALRSGARFGDVYPLLVSDPDRFGLKYFFTKELEWIPSIPTITLSISPVVLTSLNGVTGETCDICGGCNVTKSGTCSKCNDCGNSIGGCS